MTFKIAHSIRIKLFLAIVPVLLLIIVAVSYTNILSFKSFIPLYERLLIDRGSAIANTIRTAVNKNLDYFELYKFPWMAAYLSNVVENTKGLSYAVVVDATGRILYRNEGMITDFLKDVEYDQTDFSDSTTKLTLMHPDHIELVTPLIRKDVMIGTIHMGLDNHLIKEKMASLVYRTIFAVLLALGLFVPLTFLLLQKSIVVPMRNLAVKTKEISTNRDLSQRIAISGTDEIGLFASSFNVMIESLQSYYEDLQDKNQKIAATQKRLADLNRNLENKVNQRTRQIQGVNQQLQKEIQERKNIEHELVEAKSAAEAANEAKSDFLARMSHEIRTPLSAVTGLTNILLKSELKSKQRDYLNKVQIASNSLLAVIDDILDFSKIEAGRLELTPTPFDLDQVMEHLADLFSNRVQQKNLELVFAMGQKVPRLLTGDAGRLTQVLTNLVANAIKFTDQGEIVVGVDLDDTASKDQAQAIFTFWVSDTGVGIASDVQPILFEPFIQADASLTRRHEGTGLGLAICQQLVKLMGGRIWIESTPGKGSTFFFTAILGTPMERFGRPESAVSRRAQEPAGLPIQRLAGRRVLVVEDSELNRDVAVALLEAAGMKVETAVNGRIAVDKVTTLAKGYYDAILMDIQMPVMDGYEATSKIREFEKRQDLTSEQPETNTPIIALTAHALKGEKEKCLVTNMDDYLTKPLDERELHRVLLKRISPQQA